MKKVTRLRTPQHDMSTSSGQGIGIGAVVCGGGGEQQVRTTGRIKKPKAVFDPSDNYLPRAQRTTSASSSSTTAAVQSATPSFSGATAGARILRKPSTSLGDTDAESTGNATCFVCRKGDYKRGISSKNKMIACLDCGEKAHLFCLSMTFEDLGTLRQNYKCQNCRTCDLCDAFPDDEAKDDRKLVTCTKCVKSYHPTCHIPNVLKFQQSQRNWKCNKCTGPTLPVKTIREIIGDQAPFNKSDKVNANKNDSVNIAAAAAEAAVTAAAQREQKSQKKKQQHNGKNYGQIPSKKEKFDSNEEYTDQTSVADCSATNATLELSPEANDLPDVKSWTYDQVAEYMAKFFPKEAKVFRDEEIDGASLLLLKRSDVIKKLPLKLGPSLRIYSLILKIQTQVNDPTLGWNCY